MIPAVFQIIIAVVIVVVLLLVAIYQYNKEQFDALRSVGSVRKSVSIFKGIKDMAGSKGDMYSTTDNNSGSFRDLVPSVNQASGIEYSYNFWLYMDQNALTDDASRTSTASAAYNSSTGSALGSMNINNLTNTDLDAGLTSANTTAGNRHKAPLMLFLRGDPHGYNFNKVCSNPSAGSMKYDILVKNPLVKLENAGNALTVEFNTVISPDSCKTNGTDSAFQGNWASGNAHKVGIRGLRTASLQSQWFMVTVVVTETAPALGMSDRNRTTCMIYINGKIAQSQTVEGSSVRNPTGNLYVNPVIKDQAGTNNVSIDLTTAGKMQMADLTYYNYALSDGELAGLFSGGFSKNPAAPAITYTPSPTQNGLQSDGIASTSGSTFMAIG